MGSNMQDHRVRKALPKGKEDACLRFFPEARVIGCPHRPDAFAKNRIASEPEAFPQRVLIRPVPSGHRIVDNRDRHRFGTIRFREIAPYHSLQARAPATRGPFGLCSCF